ncbi:hypothetical protein MITS9509_02746 [Synechococcus sp. MIT S9509]|uniref:hypothetical protein n=1 Tax=Synechococcus sp. MIT S9504 TaxID=1801628 RepID=UPI0007BB09EF|nr:hypothetical protein [Synechococcus sp. MIT S9504]KZR85563.1 hypothetical protein MITS9504_02100 [Synechococcus sp. MIT S9504]KZR90457.1 hypothetical protein MITS9509_02746 [Synechococcus sp. MIT S9509]
MEEPDLNPNQADVRLAWHGGSCGPLTLGVEPEVCRDYATGNDGEITFTLTPH